MTAWESYIMHPHASVHNRNTIAEQLKPSRATIRLQWERGTSRAVHSLTSETGRAWMSGEHLIQPLLYSQTHFFKKCNVTLFERTKDIEKTTDSSLLSTLKMHNRVLHPNETDMKSVYNVPFTWNILYSLKGHLYLTLQLCSSHFYFPQMLINVIRLN